MSVEQLLEWSAKQPAWAQDAIRRQAGSPGFILNDADKSAVSERIRHAAGLKLAMAPDHTPVTAAHLHIGPTKAKAALLCSLGPVSNLGRLAADQKLSFALDGVTLIYGDNGSGKSGYCRITKKICRSLADDPESICAVQCTKAELCYEPVQLAKNDVAGPDKCCACVIDASGPDDHIIKAVTIHVPR